MRLFAAILLTFCSALVAAGYQFSGELKYPESVVVRVYPVQTGLPEEKQYIAAVIKAITIDNLKILKKVYVPRVDPVQVDYPYPALKSGGQPIEDPRQAWLKSSLNKSPRYFDMQIKEWPDTPVAFSKVEDEMKNLPAQVFHLFMAINPGLQSGEYSGQFILAWDGEILLKQKFSYKEDDLTGGCSVSSASLRKALAGPETGDLSVVTEPANVSVYLNNYFIGKTPLALAHLPAGEHIMGLRKEGFASQQFKAEIKQGSKLAINRKVTTATGNGQVEVVTFPAGAKVYLGVIYQGITPMTLKNVPFGIHRVRVEKEGFADRFKSIELNGQKKEHLVRMQLQPGSNADVYRIDPPVLWGFTNRDLFYASIGFSAVAAGTGLFFLTQKDRQQELAAKRFNLATGSASDSQYISDRIGDANRYQNFATVSFVSSGVFVGAAVYFFISFLQSQDLDISMKEPGRNQYAHSLGNRPALAFAAAPIHQGSKYTIQASWYF